MLNLYSGNQPNLGYSAYFFKNFDLFLSAISSQLVAQVDKTNYILDNDLFLRLKGDYGEITYVVDLDTERCYFVESIENISGYKRLNLTIDYWGSYIKSAVLESGVVNETSYSLPNGKGFMLKPQTPVGAPDYLTISGIEFTRTTPILLIMNIEYSYTKTTLFTNESVTTNKLIYALANRSTLLQQCEDYASIFEIYETNALGQEKTYPCAVTKMWAVPFADAMGSIMPSKNINLRFNVIEETTSGTTIETRTTTLPVLEPGHLIADGTYTPTAIASEWNFKFFFGTQSDYMAVGFNQNNEINVRYELRIGSDEVNTVLWFNEKNIDVTSNFEINTTTNNGTFTNQQKMAYALRNLFNVTSGAITTIKGSTSGDVGSIAHGIAQTTSSINELFEQRQGRRNYASGDGLFTWFSNNPPLTLIRYFTCEHYVYGIDSGYAFNVFVTNFEQNIKYGFIKANFNVCGVPLSASNYISQRFSGGLRVVKLGK